MSFTYKYVQIRAWLNEIIALKHMVASAACNEQIKPTAEMFCFVLFEACFQITTAALHLILLAFLYVTITLSDTVSDFYTFLYVCCPSPYDLYCVGGTLSLTQSINIHLLQLCIRIAACQKRKSPVFFIRQKWPNSAELTKSCDITVKSTFIVILVAILCSTYAHLKNFVPLQTGVNIAGTVVSHDKLLPSSQ